MEGRRKVFLTDTHWRTAYYVCKSLARKGIKVLGLKSVDSIYDKSRYYSKLISVPSFETHPNHWLSKVEQLASDDEVLIPVSTNAIRLVAENRHRLSKRMVVPPNSVEEIKMATNKLQTIQFMERIGVPTPVTFTPESLGEAEEGLREIGFPVVIKIREERNISPIHRYGIAQSMQEFRNLYNKLSSLQPFPLVQEYVGGEAIGISILCDRGKVLALFAHRRLREETSTGGPSTFCSPTNSEILEQYATQFAEGSMWSGIIMLEFKYNTSNNTFCLMEVNPRFWGSMELAIKCGVDFPYLFFQWLVGDIDKTVCFKISNSVKLKYVSKDIRAFTNSIISLDRKTRVKLLISYILEYFDPALRFWTTGGDRQIALEELSSCAREFLSMVKHVI